MKNRKLPRKLRRQLRTEGITGVWQWGDTIAIGDDHLYFDSGATTVTFPSEFSSGFAIGDIITISGQGSEKVKKKKKVHVARRRKQEKQETHTITDITATTMTISTNELLTVTKVATDEWMVYGEIT